MDKSLLKIIIILTSSSILIIVSTIVVTDIITQNQADEIVKLKTNEVGVLTDDANVRINKLASVLQTVASLSQFKTIQNSSLISHTLHGIPKDVEKEKREIAKRILTDYKELDYVFFLLPNGDMYFLEPYEQQVNLTLNNFAFRDYYKGMMATHGQYLSEAYISNNNGHHVAAISTPIYSQDGSLMGLLVVALNLQSMDDSLASIHISKNSRFIYIDQHGQIVADSKSGSSNISESFLNLDSYKTALGGKSGTSIETINGTKMFIAYSPLKILSNTWVIMLIQPYDDAFSTIIMVQILSLVRIFIILTILAVSGYYVYRLTRQKTILTEKLQQTDIAKEEFVAMITHELKTPLVTISGYADMLKENDVLGTLNKEQIKAVEAISAQTAEQERLVNDILDAHKLDLKRMKFNKRDFMVDEFMDELIQTHSKLMSDKKIHFVNSTKGKMSITSDRGRLSQVFGNLIKNSVDFVLPNIGNIEINAQSKDSQIIFYVRDNGSGIPKEKQENLFKKFYQMDTSLKRKHGGTGLGLVICKGIVEALGGKIWLESDVGKGTVVNFSLPKNQ